MVQIPGFEQVFDSHHNPRYPTHQLLCVGESMCVCGKLKDNPFTITQLYMNGVFFCVMENAFFEIHFIKSQDKADLKNKKIPL